jgi:hypothetical protein
MIDLLLIPAGSLWAALNLAYVQHLYRSSRA